jgi:hypothetical protein
MRIVIAIPLIPLIHSELNAVPVMSAQEVQNHLTATVQQCLGVVTVVVECAVVAACAAAAGADNKRKEYE